MFTGIIEHVGRVVAVRPSAPSRADAGSANRLDIDVGPLADGLRLGASVAVNGVCLTLTACNGAVGGFDAVPETWQRTTLSALRPGDGVNLERSLRAGDRIDGHFVQGHVEAVGRVERIDRAGGDWTLWVETDEALMPAIVPKGSIALDGTSLTVVAVRGRSFSAALVPTSLERTVLGRRTAGAAVNIETDILARIVLRALGRFPGGATPGGVTWESLRESGFLA